MAFGLSDKAITRIVEVLARHPAVESAVIYGSRARGDFKPGSDIDLTLHGAALDRRALLDIADELDELLLPQTIDLSWFAELNHPELKTRIKQEGVEFYRRVAS